MLKSRKKTACIIGLGNIGLTYDFNSKSKTKSHFSALKKSKYFKLVAGVERKQKKILKKIDLQIFKNIEDLSKIYNPYLIVISVPTNKHIGIFLDIVKHLSPKIILFEKPMGKNIIEAKKIVKICKKNQISLFVNYIRNYLPNLDKLKKLIYKKKLLVHLRYSGKIDNDFCHYFYLFDFLFGLKLNYRKRNLEDIFKNCTLKITKNKKSQKDNLQFIAKNLLIDWKNDNFVKIKTNFCKKILNLDLENYQHHVINNIAQNIFYNKKTCLISGQDALRFHKLFNDKKTKINKKK